jgi:Sin3 histone deacetylase corepressor complex component SDS3
MSAGALLLDSAERSGETSSDEDTEDASEPETVRMEEEEAKSSSFEEKLAALHAQLKQVEDGTDLDFLQEVARIKEERDKRLFVAESFRVYETQCVKEEFEREKTQAETEFEVKKVELKECLMHDQQDKKRAYENYRHTAELSTGGGLDSFEPKTMVTRKLRRRHYEPLPMPEKRRKLAPLSSLVYVLDEHEVDDDLKVIFKGKITANPKLLTSPVPVAKNDGGAVYEARIEDGKLYYENRAFHKGQHIFIDSKEHGQESGIISSVGQSEIWVKRLPDNSKLRIYVTQLVRGKYVLKRRSA